MLVVGLASACTSVLGIDGEYVVQGSISTGGRTAAGGSVVDTGGAAGSGGTGGSLGIDGGRAAGGKEAGAGGANDAQADCGLNQKRCTIGDTSACVAPDPSVGCSMTGCTACTWPTGGYGICNGSECDFGCLSGYVKNGSRCDRVQTDSGTSSGGGGGTGGLDRCAKDSDCPACAIPFPPGCCIPTLVSGQLVKRCGCLYLVYCQPY